MNTIIASYSFSGNNNTFAENLARKMNVPHIQIKEAKNRTMATIVLDLLFNRTPKVEQEILPDNYDLIILVGPVWMGKLATPLRGYLKKLRDTHDNYCIFSICGGPDGDNQKLPVECQKLTGFPPVVLTEFAISKLLPQDPPPTREMVSQYKISQEDIEKITDLAIEQLTPLV